MARPRRLEFLGTPARCFRRDGGPVRAEQVEGLFREGVPRVPGAAEPVRRTEAVAHLAGLSRTAPAESPATGR